MQLQLMQQKGHKGTINLSQKCIHLGFGSNTRLEHLTIMYYYALLN